MSANNKELCHHHNLKHHSDTQASSVDQAEVDRFSELAKAKHFHNHAHKDHLESLTNLKLTFLKRCIETAGVKGSLMIPKQADSEPGFSSYKVLDMGCGSGNNAKALAALGARVVAVDPSPEIIKTNLENQEEQIGNGTIEYRIGTAEQLATSLSSKHSSWCNGLWPFSSGCIIPCLSNQTYKEKDLYDIIMATDVIEHVSNPRLFLSSLDKLLKPGGLLMLTAPNRTIFSRISVIFMAEKVLKAVPLGTHVWRKFIKPNELTAFMKRSLPQRNWLATRMKTSSPLTPKSADDESLYVSADYEEIGRRGEVFLPVIHKWIRVPFLGMHYMIAYKKKTFFN